MASFRLSPQQRRLWRFVEQGAPFNGVLAVGVPEADEDAIRAAVRRLVERHQALRTRFERRPGLRIPVQVVSAAADFDWARLDGVELPDLVAAEADRCLEPSAPPVRARLLASGDRSTLVLSVPALCADAWSLGNAADELSRLLAGEELPDVLQYPRYAGFQNDLAEEEDDDERQEALAHWRRVFAGGASLTLSLPLTAPTGEGPFRPERAVAVEAEGPALERVAARLEVEPQVVLAAAWSGYLARLAGGEATVGHLVDGREYEVLEPVVGLLSRACPIPVREVERRSLASLVAAHAGALQEAAEWADHLDLGAFEEGGGGPLRFDALFEVERRPTTASRRPFLEQLVQEPFLVRLSVRRPQGETALELAWDPQRLDAAAAERLRRGFAVFLATALDAPERPVGELPLVDAPERRRLLAEVFTGPAAAEPPLTVPERIAAAARRNPAATAVIAGGETLTRAALAERSGRLARRLAALGVGPEVTVGLCCERSVDLVVALVAVLEAGGAYVPIDPELPGERREAMLAAAGARVLVTHRGRVTSAARGCRVLELDAPEGDAGEAARPAAVAPGALAYVLFTSGSTGSPKGVGVEHRHLASYLAALDRRLALPDGEPLTFAMVSTPAADLGNTVLFTALCGRGALLLVDAEPASDPAALATLFEAHPVDVLKIVPSHLAALLAGGEGARRLLPRRLLVCGGEALDPSLVKRVRRLSADLRIVNHYGPTETTVGVLTWEIGAAAGEASPADELLPGAVGSVPVGRPLAGCQAYVLDAGLSSAAGRLERRAAPGRRPGGARLPRAAGTDRLVLRPRSPLSRAGGPGLPQRRPGEGVAVGGDRVPRPPRRAGEDPRLPGRAGGGCAPARGAPRRRPGLRGRPPGPGRPAAARRLRGGGVVRRRRGDRDVAQRPADGAAQPQRNPAPLPADLRRPRLRSPRHGVRRRRLHLRRRGEHRHVLPVRAPALPAAADLLLRA
jgi:non-ribosomal peptide synthetase component F